MQVNMQIDREREKDISLFSITKFSPLFFWVFLLIIIMIIAHKIYLLINSTCSDYENDNELINFENEDEEKLYILTKIFTKINSNINNDIKNIADKGNKKLRKNNKI